MQKAGYNDIDIAFNCSPRQFIFKGFLESLRRILTHFKINPNRLEVEITETVAMEDVDFTVKLLKRLRNMGIKGALDDFGTGYSSLSCLRNFPIDFLKIDRSFIRGVPADVNNVALVKSIMTLGHGLGLQIIAEGVETIEECEFLTQIKCDEVQGFYFSKPIPQEPLFELLKLDQEKKARK
jgi:EAL domain-containing protein (putative c-di-GMP-specific phosphodiesterase class I)